MQIPIRIRLSISYFVIFSVAGILLCFASYLMARRSLYTAFDHDLDERVDDVHDFFAAHDLGNDLVRARTQVAAEFDLKDEGKWLQIQNDRGRWIYRARRMMIAPHDVPPAGALPPKGSLFVFSADGKRIRSLRRAFTLNGHAFVVETGSTLTKTDQTLLLYRHGLFLILPVIFLMAGLAGHLMSRNALAPVAAIARETQRIHEGNLQTRLPQLDTHDELAHLSQTLNEMLERIESDMRSVRDFTAYASHELRTPLALIRTEAELALQKERSSLDYRDALAIIGAEAQRMSSLLDSLLFLARADAGAERAQICAVDARQLCMEMHEKLRPAFQRAQIRFRCDLPPRATMVMADPMHLQRMLMIVLENAAKYTEAGGLVKLILQRAGERAHFEVADTGIGIPEDDRAHIFEKFRRGSNAREKNVHGSGLGLALAAWIAENHQTKIRVKSVTGFGSNFSWTLSLACETGDQDCSAEVNARVGQLSIASIYK
jgi:signal transduction histidine kinase